MITSLLKPHVKELLDKVTNSDVIKIEDINFFLQHPYQENDPNIIESAEDHHAMIMTELSGVYFDWYEVREESEKLNDREWKIGDKTVSFFTLQPI
jgi:hypothetical protein